MTFRRWRSTLAWALFILIVISPRELDAHAHLERSFPASDEHLHETPTMLRLWFSEQPVLSLTRLRLLGPDSGSISLGVLTSGAEMSVTASIPQPLGAGTYTVVWQTAAADGHPSTGRFKFIVDAPGSASADGSGRASTRLAGASSSADSTVARRDSQAKRRDERGNALIAANRDTTAMVSGRGYVAARWVEFIALLTAIGAIVFRFGLAGIVAMHGGMAADAAGQSGVLDSVMRLLRQTLVLLLLAELIRLGGEWQMVRMAGAADVPLFVLLNSSWGYGWLVGVAGIAIAIVGAMAMRRARAGWEIAAVGTLLAALSPAVTGHAIAAPNHQLIAVTADALHVLGAGAWMGTLFVIVLAVLPALRDEDREGWGSRTSILLTAFSPIALTGAALVVTSGVVSAWLRLGSFGALLGSTYGNVLLIKVVLAVIIVLLGAWNWRSVQPAVAAGESPLRIRRSASVELTVAAFLLVTTAILIALPTPV